MHQLVEDKLDIGIDYTVSQSSGEISIESSTPFPTLRTRFDSLKLFANYRLKETVDLQAAFWHENYQSSDWTLNDVAPDIISNVLTLGEEAPSYEVNLISLSVRYRF